MKPGRLSASKKSVDTTPEAYAVEQILEKRIEAGNQVMYKVKWQGYDISESTWEPEINLQCPILIKKFESENRPKSNEKSGEKKVVEESVAGDGGLGRGKRRKLSTDDISVVQKPPVTPASNSRHKEKKQSTAKKNEGDRTLYNVERISDKRITRSGFVEYLVKWEGYQTPTWEPTRYLLHCQALIDAFEKELEKQELAKQKLHSSSSEPEVIVPVVASSPPKRPRAQGFNLEMNMRRAAESRLAEQTKSKPVSKKKNLPAPAITLDDTLSPAAPVVSASNRTTEAVFGELVAKKLLNLSPAISSDLQMKIMAMINAAEFGSSH